MPIALLSNTLVAVLHYNSINNSDFMRRYRHGFDAQLTTIRYFQSLIFIPQRLLLNEKISCFVIITL